LRLKDYNKGLDQGYNNSKESFPLEIQIQNTITRHVNGNNNKTYFN